MQPPIFDLPSSPCRTSAFAVAFVAPAFPFRRASCPGRCLRLCSAAVSCPACPDARKGAERTGQRGIFAFVFAVAYVAAPFHGGALDFCAVGHVAPPHPDRHITFVQRRRSRPGAFDREGTHSCPEENRRVVSRTFLRDKPFRPLPRKAPEGRHNLAQRGNAGNQPPREALPLGGFLAELSLYQPLNKNGAH